MDCCQQQALVWRHLTSHEPAFSFKLCNCIMEQPTFKLSLPLYIQWVEKLRFPTLVYAYLLTPSMLYGQW